MSVPAFADYQFGAWGDVLDHGSWATTFTLTATGTDVFSSFVLSGLTGDTFVVPGVGFDDGVPWVVGSFTPTSVAASGAPATNSLLFWGVFQGVPTGNPFVPYELPTSLSFTADVFDSGLPVATFHVAWAPGNTVVVEVPVPEVGSLAALGFMLAGVAGFLKLKRACAGR